MVPRWVRYLACLTLLAGCTTGADTGSNPVPAEESDASASTSEDAGTSASDEASASPTVSRPAQQTPTRTPLDDAEVSATVAGAITTTGVPVAVLDELQDGLLVRTPCGNAAVLSVVAEQFATVDVVLDPGHGGPIDEGAVGPNGLSEKQLNLDVAVAAETMLEERGISALLTRTADYPTPLSVRAALADTLHAGALISIHHNAPTPNPSTVPGTEIFVQSASAESGRLGGLIWANVVDALSAFEGVAWSSATDAGALAVIDDEGTDAYGMVRRPRTVAVLAEFAYISNLSEAELMTTPEYVAATAAALADAVEAFIGDPAAQGKGHVAEPRVFNPQRAPGENECIDVVLE